MVRAVWAALVASFASPYVAVFLLHQLGVSGSTAQAPERMGHAPSGSFMDILFLDVILKVMTAIGLFVFVVSLALIAALKALHRHTLRNVIASGCATGAILVPIVAMDGYPGPWSSGEGLWRLSFACTIGLISGAACGLTYWAIATSGRRRTNML